MAQMFQPKQRQVLGRGRVIDGNKVVAQNRARNAQGGSSGYIRNNSTGETAQSQSDTKPQSMTQPTQQQLTKASQDEMQGEAYDQIDRDAIYEQEEYNGGGDYGMEDSEVLEGVQEQVAQYNKYLKDNGITDREPLTEEFFEGIGDSDDLYEAQQELEDKVTALPKINTKAYYSDGVIQPRGDIKDRMQDIGSRLLDMIPPKERQQAQAMMEEDDRNPLDQIIDIYNELSNDENPIDPEMVYAEINDENDEEEAFTAIEERIEALGDGQDGEAVKEDQGGSYQERLARLEEQQ